MGIPCSCSALFRSASIILVSVYQFHFQFQFLIFEIFQFEFSFNFLCTAKFSHQNKFADLQEVQSWFHLSAGLSVGIAPSLFKHISHKSFELKCHKTLFCSFVT